MQIDAAVAVGRSWSAHAHRFSLLGTLLLVRVDGSDGQSDTNPILLEIWIQYLSPSH